MANKSIRKRWPNERQSWSQINRSQRRVWISVRHAHSEGEHGGEIREGFYDSFDGKVIVTDTKGKLIGSAADYGNPAAVARTILRKHIADQPKPLRI